MNTAPRLRNSGARIHESLCALWIGPTGKGALLALALAASQRVLAKGLALEQDFKQQSKQGITFFFFGSPDEGMYLTLQGSKAVFRYLDGTKADGSLQKRTDTGSFNYANGRVTLHGEHLKKDVTLTLKPFESKIAVWNASKARFLLVGPEFPFGGYGPVDAIPAKRRPTPFTIKEK